ncbi:hypothetical protein ACHHYP_00118 [Achlya hypogyna]|uniref:EF-hand domain-containing protein n=1 Tax=Achlya hypogyna TaxID=1202772 RepID=A0A1V9ZBF0_ACHHY|nr:hypothetical protein ACHHYP_00118 [Achlya hypogyna]
MDLMMRLKGQAFKAISEEFKVREASIGGEGLPLQDFVEIMLRALPKPKSPAEKTATVCGLVDLFNDIDVNGDGTLEFNEFTSYCVDAGMVATRVKVAPLKYQYIKNRTFVDRTTQGGSIEKLKWFPDIHRALAVEAKSTCVKVYPPDFLKAQEVYPASGPAVPSLPTVVLPAAAPETDTGGSWAAPALDVLVLDAEFLGALRLLAISTSNFVLSFYDLDHYEYVMESQTSVAQTLLRWCDPAHMLFSTGNNKILNVWSVARGRIALVKQLYQHVDVVTDVLAVPQYDVVISSDMKRYIYLWDIQDCRPRGALVGHTHGVRQMVFSAMNDLLLTAGFEFDAFGWDISSKQRIMTLSGHRASLVGVQLARFHTERAVTADVTGVFKIWNIHRLNGSHAQLLESIAPASTIAHFNPRSFVTLPPKRDIVAASCVLHIFESIKIQKHDEIPLRAFFQHSSNQFLGLTETSVNLWDGATGLLLEEFTGLTQSSFVLCCQDMLRRKLVTATDDGAVEVYNCTNLARVRRSTGNIGRIGSLHYDSKNKLIIATTNPPSPSEVGGIFVFDDSTMGECVLVRSLTNVEVTASAFSFNASLLATVAGDRCVRCWDFETLQLQIVCRTDTADVHVVAFADPYPVLVAADGAGNVFFFATSPQYSCNTGGCLHAFTNMAPSPEGPEHAVVVTTLACLFHEDYDRYVLITGDDEGRVAIWDLSSMLHRLRLHPIPEDKLKCKRRGYNARNTFARTFNADRLSEAAHRHTPRLPDDILRRLAPKRDSDQRVLEANIKPREHHHGGTIRTGANVVVDGPYWEVKDVVQLQAWVAHGDAISSIEVNDRPNVLLTCAFDAAINVWDWRGKLLGGLTTNEDDMRTQNWRFVREDAKRERERQRVVADILAALDKTPAQRAAEASAQRQSVCSTDKVNPLLQSLLFEAPGKKLKKRSTAALFRQAAGQRKRQTPGHAKEVARHTSLMQVGPLISVKKQPIASTPVDDDASDDAALGVGLWEIARHSPEANNKTKGAPTLTERLLRLQHQERLKAKTDTVYTNLVHMQRDKHHRTSAVKRNALRDVDTSLSPFLADKLGPEKDPGAPLRRPTTAPAAVVSGRHKPRRATLTRAVASLAALDDHDDHLRRLIEASPSTGALLAKDGSAAAPSLGRLRRINSILATASAYAEGPEAAPKSPASLFEATMMTDGRDLAAQHKHARAMQTKLDKDKRMQRYLAQKKRDAHSKIGEALRHTSVLFSTAATSDMLDSVAKPRRFGIYTTKEVMVIIRLFWTLDVDGSGSVTETELNGCRHFFESMGYTDMSTIFHTIDADNSGQVTLAELLRICFVYATPAELHDMLALEKIGRAPAIFAEAKALTPAQLAELREIFTVFDRDCSGTVSFEEVLEALQCRHDDDDAAATIQDLAALYQAADGDGNKELSFEEFVQLLQELYHDKSALQKP